MTHSRLQSQQLEASLVGTHDELLDNRVEEMRREVETPIVVAQPRKKTSMMRGLLIPIAVILLWFAITQYRFFNLQSGQTVFELSEVEVLGSSDLCPGDSLRFRVDVEVLEQGIYSLSMSTWRRDPPATVVFSEGLDMVIADSREFPIAIEWLIPENYVNPYSGQSSLWTAGNYSRDVAVTAVGRNTTPSIVTIPFAIRESCPMKEGG